MSERDGGRGKGQGEGKREIRRLNGIFRAGNSLFHFIFLGKKREINPTCTVAPPIKIMVSLYCIWYIGSSRHLF